MRARTTLVVNDLHVPFHNRILLKKLCKLAVDLRPDHFVIAGDLGDYYSVSRHHSGSLAALREITLGYEYDCQNAVLDDLDAALGRRCKKEACEGNHEGMAIRWLEAGDNAKVAGAFAMPREALRMEERGYTYHENWKEAKVSVGSLDILHGEYCPQHCAKKHLDEHEGSVLHGHTHRTQSFVTGKRGAWSVGGLGDWAHPAFGYATASQRRRWSNAFAVVHSFDNGEFLPYIVQCWSNRFVYAGRTY